MTRVLAIADLHCGHVAGLTPPDWDKRPGDAYGTSAYAFYKHRRDTYKWYADWCAKLIPAVVIINGDAIDGRAEKAGGRELITGDRNEQVDMAAAAIAATGAKKIVMSYGTAYHVGRNEDWEKKIAEHKRVEAVKIGGEDNINVHGIVINYRHKASRSSIPHGRGTPLAKEQLWNQLWADRGEFPKADIILRAHNHYFAFIGDADWLAIAQPGLQGYGSIYGTREVIGTIDFGLCWFDIEETGWGWDWALKRFNRRRDFALVI